MSETATLAPAPTSFPGSGSAGLAALLSDEEWLVRETGLDLERANVAETLFTVGNGRLGTRGCFEEGHVGERSGTFLSGVYDAHAVPVTDLVNCPDWLPLAVVVDGVRLDVQSCTVVEHERALDLRQGLLWRRTVFADAQGRRIQLESLRFASLADRRLCGIRAEVTLLDHNATVTVESGLDGRRRNLERLPAYPDGTVFDAEVRWDKWATAQHLREVAATERGEALYLQVRTIGTNIEIGYATRLQSSAAPVGRRVRRRYEQVGSEEDFTLRAGEPLRVDKLVSIVTSRDAPGDLAPAALDLLEQHAAAGLDAALTASVAAWASAWEDCDCVIEGDVEATRAVRFGIYHLLIAANPDDPTVNIGAKSLSGEGYRGHVFWDTEVLMLPFFVHTQPATALSLLRYRHHTLPAARELAAASGLRGARYPWESADTGREECPVATVDGLHRFWTRDQEIHVSADVVHGILSYVEATGDETFLHDQGAEILFETSRFWADRAELDPEAGHWSLRQVMGPDEFHSFVDDNAFTNELARWSLRRSAEVHDALAQDHPDALATIAQRIDLAPDEVTRWRTVAEGLAPARVREDGVIEQFRGYFDRLDVPVTSWDENDMPRYPEGYHHFNCEGTMLLKQPDVVMLLHMLPGHVDAAAQRANFAFYEARTLHKSSLSPAVHAIAGLQVGDTTRALQYFRRSAFVDLADNQGNTAEGMHIASAGGTWQILVYGFGGFAVRDGRLAFDPWLPLEWSRLRFRLQWRGNAVDVAVGPTEVTFTLHAPPGTTEDVIVRGRPIPLTPQQVVTVPLN